MAGAPSESVLDIIEKRLIPNEEAKKARGEVFTPLPLVRELLFGVRKDKPTEVWGMNAEGELFDDPAERMGGIPLEIWKNPESKWLDPANGIGNFPFVAFQMLDYQLKDVLKDTTERRKHIVEKMLFMIEIDKGNVNTAIKIFGQLAPGTTVNICCADTLKLKDADLTREFGTSKFDVIMGNPPFQAPVLGKHFAGKIPQIWDKFVLFSLGRLVPNGFLAFITPPQWRSPESGVWKPMIMESRLIFLHIFGEKDSFRHFKVGSRIDMFLLQRKHEGSSEAFVIDETQKSSKIDTALWPFFPNYAFDDIAGILTTKDSGIKVIYTTAYHSAPSGKNAIDKPRMVADDVYKYPVVHSITSTGLGIRYVKDNSKGHFGVPKVILNKNRNQYPINDFEGKYGMTEMSFGIPIQTKEEGDLIVRAINSDRFKEIIKATKWGSFYTNYHMFEYFKPDFYKEFLPKEGGSRRRTRRAKRRGTTRRQNGNS